MATGQEQHDVKGDWQGPTVHIHTYKTIQLSTNMCFIRVFNIIHRKVYTSTYIFGAMWPVLCWRVVKPTKTKPTKICNRRCNFFWNSYILGQHGCWIVTFYVCIIFLTLHRRFKCFNKDKYETKLSQNCPKLFLAICLFSTWHWPFKRKNVQTWRCKKVFTIYVTQVVNICLSTVDIVIHYLNLNR